MTGDITVARRYLLPPDRSFWHWQAGGDVVAWQGGSTIAFRAELVQILRRLAPERLPPLSTLLLVLAATRDNWDELPFEVGDSAAWGFTSEEAPEIAALLVNRNGLRKLRELDPELRCSVEAKVVLAESVFEQVRPVATPEEAAIILQYLEHGIVEVLQEATLAAVMQQPVGRLTHQDLRDLRRRIEAVDAAALRLRCRTSLDQLPLPATVELSQAQQVRNLLGLLQHDSELQGLARLARQLMAAVSLPRAVSDPDELQIGGLSDITNRGPLDRLLLTELVHDDLTLAVRVSVNEALYLRRESPPRTPERERALLLESGIRSWGAPRVFATAVALALVATTDSHTRVATFRAQGADAIPIDLLSREGLIEHLEALQPESHPGDALHAFARHLAEGKLAAQPVIVTTEDVLADEAFVQALTHSPLATVHVATVNRDGDFLLIERNLRGRKTLRQARLDLATLFADEPARRVSELIDRDWVTDLPAVFSILPFPLLLSTSLRQEQMIHLKDQGVLGVTKDGRLMHWHQMQPLGAVQLSDALPIGRLHWYPQQSTGATVLAVLAERQSHALHLLKVRLHEQKCETVVLELAKTARIIAIHNGVVLAVQDNQLLSIDKDSGEVVEQTDVPNQVAWKQDRFFRNAMRDQWYAAGFDGRSTRFEPVFDRDPDQTPWLFTMFECDGVEGPVGITRSGDVCFTATGETWQVERDPVNSLNIALNIANVQHHGSRVVLQTKGTEQIGGCVVDVVTRTVSRWKRGDAFSLLYPNAHRFITPRSHRHRFSQIDVETAAGQPKQLILVSRKQMRLAIRFMDSDVPALRHVRLMPHGKGAATSPRARAFKQLKTPQLGFSLSRAQWDDGSEAFLDSRGLLHLRSSDRTIPEVTIVLADGELGGWCSDGRLWGAKYYTGRSRDAAVDQDVYHGAIAGFIRGIL